MVIRRSVLSALVLLSSTVPAFAMTYPDVDYSHPYVQGILGMTNVNMVHGYEDGLFRPDRGLSRIEALKIILNSANIATNGYSSTQYIATKLDWKGNPLPAPTSFLDSSSGVDFPDIPVDSWYAPYVNAGENLSIISGYPDGKFHPQSFVTRLEAYKMLFRAFGVLKDAPTEGENWFMPYMQFAVQHNLSNYAPDQLGNLQAMQDIITRGEFTDLAFRIRNISVRMPDSKFSKNSYPDVTVTSGDVIDTSKFGTTTTDATLASTDSHYQRMPNSETMIYTAANMEEAQAIATDHFKKTISLAGIQLAERNYAAMAYPFDRSLWHMPFETTGMTYEQWYAMKATGMLDTGYLKDTTL